MAQQSNNTEEIIFDNIDNDALANAIYTAERTRATKRSYEEELAQEQQLHLFAIKKARISAELAHLQAEKAQIQAEKAQIQAEKTQFASEKAQYEAEKRQRAESELTSLVERRKDSELRLLKLTEKRKNRLNTRGLKLYKSLRIKTHLKTRHNQLTPRKTQLPKPQTQTESLNHNDSASPQQSYTDYEVADSDIQISDLCDTHPPQEQQQQRAHFKIIHQRVLREKLAPRFRAKTVATQYVIEHNIGTFPDPLQVRDSIDEFYHELVFKHIEHLKPSDRVSVSFTFEKLPNDLHIHFSRESYDKRALCDRLGMIAQSNATFLLGGRLAVNISIIDTSEGARRTNGRGAPPIGADDLSELSKSIVTIRNHDNLCGWRAVSLGLWLIQNESLLESNAVQYRKEWTKLKDDRATQSHSGPLKELAIQLLRASNIIEASAKEGPTMNATHWNTIDTYLRTTYEIQLIIFNRKDREKLYGNGNCDKYIALEFCDPQDNESSGHYNLITKLHSFKQQRFFCPRCLEFKSVKPKRTHQCDGGRKRCCSKCNSIHGELDSDALQGTSSTCPQCKIICASPQCLEAHLRNKVCKNAAYCDKCELIYTKTQPHKCFKFTCPKCGSKDVDSRHACCLSQLDKDRLKKEDGRPKIIITYDIEACIDPETNEHTPALLISRTCCTVCHKDGDSVQNSSQPNLCELCGSINESQVFWGKQCVTQYMEYILELAKKAAKRSIRVYVFAHNSKGYDCHFILKEAISRDFPNIALIATGNKIQKMTINNLTFLDTLPLFMQALDSLPKAFDLGKQVKKGFFPYRLLTHDMLDGRILEFPSRDWFDTQHMKPKKKAEFEAWFTQTSATNSQYDIKAELEAYCRNDVDILHMAIMKFRQVFISITGLDPITRKFTLAGIAMECFRTNFLKEDQLGIIPVNQYRPRGSQSLEGKIWIDWLERSLGKRLDREVQFTRYYADAYDAQTNTIYEFNGCHWHGCLECHPNPTSRTRNLYNNALSEGKNAKVSETYEGRYEKLLEKRAYYAKHGFVLHEIWEHEYARRMAEDQAFNAFVIERTSYYKNIATMPDPSPRDALFGGRTCNVKFHHVAQDDESIRYLDFTSLYPYVLSTEKYPLRHPIVITQDFDYSLESYFGLVRCRVEPPKRLRFGVLPYRHENKLLFPLCGRCLTDKDLWTNPKSCECTATQRQFTGLWTTPELKYAVMRGYKIHEIYSVYHYSDRSDDLFKGYIRMWLREKQEASGWPSHCTTEESKNAYIKDYFDNEGIQLRPEGIKKNPGRRLVSKLMLNSLWGKFAQRPNLEQTSIVTTYAKACEILGDPSKEVRSFSLPDSDHLLINWRYQNDESAALANTNVILASFVTSYARLKLLKKLEEIETRHGRVLYFDTDSIIFTQQSGDPEVSTGDFLGMLTDELTDFGPGAQCKTFMSAGPKNYAYEVSVPNSNGLELIPVIKSKGVTLTVAAREKINVQSMSEMIKNFLNNTPTELRVEQFNINASIRARTVRSQYYSKLYRVTSNKRRIVGNDTVAYGFVDCPNCGYEISCDGCKRLQKEERQLALSYQNK